MNLNRLPLFRKVGHANEVCLRLSLKGANRAALEEYCVSYVMLALLDANLGLEPCLGKNIR